MKIVKYFYPLIPLFLILACTNNEQYLETKVQIAIHDAPFALQGKTVESLFITIKKIDFVRNDGKIFLLSDKEQTMDILKIQANAPVILSTVSIEPGIYSQLRLVVKDDSIITVDGESFPIKIPSGMQTGVKLEGDFDISRGQFFKIVLDFDAQKSVIWNEGQGYILKPVIHITGTSPIKGYYRGNLAMDDSLGVTETVLEMTDTNRFKMKVSDYPNYNLYGNYFYNSDSKILRFYNFDLDAPDLNSDEKNEVMKEFPSDFTLNVIQWSILDILVIDYYGAHITLESVPDFSFSQNITYTHLYVTVKYPDNSQNGKMTYTKLDFEDGPLPYIAEKKQIIGDNTIIDFTIPDAYLRKPENKVNLVSYLFNRTEDIQTLFTKHNGKYVMSLDGSNIKETTENPWTPKLEYTVIKGTENYAALTFPKRLNISIIPNDFSTDSTLISWESYPERAKYCALVLTYKNNKWNLAFQKITTSTSFNFNMDILGTMIQGNQMRVEVYALDDNSTILDTEKKTGALFMDSKNITKK